MAGESQPKFALYTCLFGDYERLNELSVIVESDWEAICFTDNPELTSQTWEVRYVKPDEESAIVRSRHPKILPHLYLSDFEGSLYIDNAVTLIAPPSVPFHKLIRNKPMGIFHHITPPLLIWNFVENLVRGKESESVLSKHVEHIYSRNPNSLRKTYGWGAMLARRHNDSRVIQAMEKWWELFTSFSKRDELSMPESLEILEGDLSIYSGDPLKTEFHMWPTGLGRKANSSVTPKGQISSPYLELAYYFFASHNKVSPHQPLTS